MVWSPSIVMRNWWFQAIQFYQFNLIQASVILTFPPWNSYWKLSRFEVIFYSLREAFFIFTTLLVCFKGLAIVFHLRLVVFRFNLAFAFQWIWMLVIVGRAVFFYQLFRFLLSGPDKTRFLILSTNTNIRIYHMVITLTKIDIKILSSTSWYQMWHVHKFNSLKCQNYVCDCACFRNDFSLFQSKTSISSLQQDKDGNFYVVC